MRERGDIVGCCNKGLICGYGWLEVEAAASRDAMEIQYRVWGDTFRGGGGGTHNSRIEYPGETLETRWGHFFLG